MQRPLLRVQNLAVSFIARDKTRIDAVSAVSFDIASKQTVALVGESGSGKSVTATAIMRLLPRSACISAASRIELNGRDLLALDTDEMRAIRGKDIAMVFQDPMSSLNPLLTVGEQIAESLRLHLKLDRRRSIGRAIELLNEVGIARPELRVRSYPHELSGGQQQRVMIALAIACQPQLLIADEPTTALDVTVQQQIIELLMRLREQHGMAVLFITHDLNLVKQLADEVVVMRHGEVCERNSTSELFASPQHPYTRALIACRPQLNSRPQRLPVIDDYLQANAGTVQVSTQVRRRGSSPDDAVVLSVERLSKQFGLRKGVFARETVMAVEQVSFKVPRGKTLGIVGESGSGKSTTALALLRLIRPSAGRVWFDGKELLSLSEHDLLPFRRRMQIVFQNPYASLNPRFTVQQLLLEPMQIHRIGHDTRERIQLAASLLQRVGLSSSVMQRYPHEFSGGQRQRIAIARCLSMRPELLILDEAVAALDVSVQAQVLNLLQDLQDEFGLSYIFISHDLRVVKYISDVVLVMQRGRVVEMADADELYAAPKTDYAKQLLAAVEGE